MERNKRILINLLVVVSLILKSTADVTNVPELDDRMYELTGDIIIGGLFPLHQAGQGNDFCGPLRELGVLQRAEAMAFYIREINRKKMIPGVKLGYKILDGCYKETTALAQTLKFVANRGDGADDVVAVIGAESSSNSKQVAELLGLFQIPQISYLSTSEELSDRVKYPYFTRIVPSDVHQIQAVISLLEHYNWNYISFVTTASVYGFNAYLEFNEQIKNICIAKRFLLKEDANETDYKIVIKQLASIQHDASAHAVILFLPQPDAASLLWEAQNFGLVGKLTWIASDAWGRNVQDFNGIEPIAEGTLTMRINSTNDKEFDRHFGTLDPRRSDNPFMEEFWEASCNQSHVNCTEEENFKGLDIYKPENTVSLVKIAVYLLANQINELLAQCRSQHRGTPDLCEGEHARNFINGTDLQSYLRNIAGCIGTTCIDIGPNGDGKPEYSVRNFQKIRGQGKYVLKAVGTFYHDNLRIDGQNVIWNPKIESPKKSKNGAPRSLCSLPCHLGQKQVRSISEHSRCCWKCDDCAADEVTYTHVDDGLSTMQCKKCDSFMYKNLSITLFTKPINQSRNCEIIIPQSITASDTLALVVLIFDMIFLIMTIALLALYIKNRNHRLIKATSRELSGIIWAGVIFSYVTGCWFFLPLSHGCDTVEKCELEPQITNCYAVYVSFNLAFTIIYAPILIRVNRIYRIFSQGRKTPKRPKMIETKYQLVFISILIVFQMIIVTITAMIGRYAFDEPLIKINNFQADVNTSYLTCDIHNNIFVPPVVYNLLLTIACAVHAFKIRKLPDNFNESRFIALTVYTTFIMWIAFVPSYLTINSKQYSGVPLTLALMLNALITTACLFIPKLYALRWVGTTKLNVRSQSMQSAPGESRRASLAVPEQFSDQLSSSRSELYQVGSVRFSCDTKLSPEQEHSSDSGCEVNSSQSSPADDPIVESDT